MIIDNLGTWGLQPGDALITSKTAKFHSTQNIQISIPPSTPLLVKSLNPSTASITASTPAGNNIIILDSDIKFGKVTVISRSLSTNY
jgi:hypothetical protein